MVKPWKAKARFYEGEIKADLILGYPWLAQNGLDVLTREGCLGLRMGNKCYTITACPEIEQWDDVPLNDTRPIQQIECNARRSKPKRLWAHCPAWLNRWASAQVAHIEGLPASQPLGWHAAPPVSFHPRHKMLWSHAYRTTNVWFTKKRQMPWLKPFDHWMKCQNSSLCNKTHCI